MRAEFFQKILILLVTYSIFGCSTNKIYIDKLYREEPIYVPYVLGSASGAMLGAAHGEAETITRAANSNELIKCRQATWQIASAAKKESGKLKGNQLRSAIFEATKVAVEKFGIGDGCVNQERINKAASILANTYPSLPAAAAAGAGAVGGGGIDFGHMFDNIQSFLTSRVFNAYGKSNKTNTVGAFTNVVRPITDISEIPVGFSNFIYVLCNRRASKDGITMVDYRKKCQIILEQVNKYRSIIGQTGRGGKINGLLVPSSVRDKQHMVTLDSYDFNLAMNIVSKVNSSASHFKDFESLRKEGPYLVMSNLPIKDIDQWTNFSVIDFSSIHHDSAEHLIFEFLERFEDERFGTSPITILEKSTMFASPLIVSLVAGYPVEKLNAALPNWFQ